MLLRFRFTFASFPGYSLRSHMHQLYHWLCSYCRNRLLLLLYRPTQKLPEQIYSVLPRSPVSELGSGTLIVNNLIGPSKAIKVESWNNTRTFQERHTLVWNTHLGVSFKPCWKWSHFACPNNSMTVYFHILFLQELKI